MVRPEKLLRLRETCYDEKEAPGTADRAFLFLALEKPVAASQRPPIAA
jgi:hypothetical protein